MKSGSAKGHEGERDIDKVRISFDLPHAALLIYRIKQWRVKSTKEDLEKVVGELHGVDENLKVSSRNILGLEDQNCSSSRSKTYESREEEEEETCAIARPKGKGVKRNDTSYVSLSELSLNQDSKTSLDILKEMLTTMTKQVSMLEKAVRRVQSTPPLDEFQIGLQKQVVSASSLLKAEHFEALYHELPKRYKRHRWELLYSTTRDGTSLQTLYRHVAKVQPTILLVKDMQGHLFGVFAPEPWEVHYKFYGTGETFVFELEPELHIYHWNQRSQSSRRNDYFMFSTKDCLAVGGGGHFALWLDEDLIHGNSTCCETFENDTLSGSENFQVMSLEVMHMCI